MTALRPVALPGVRWADLLGEFGTRLQPAGPSAVAGQAAAADLSGDPLITGITADSRLVQPGDLYLAVAGASQHGADFAADAIARGASALLTDPAGEDRVQRVVAGMSPHGSGSAELAEPSMPVLVSANPRALIPELANRIYAEPAGRLRLFGITGTNGKTTTAYLLQAALRAAGHRVGLVGTLGYQLDDQQLVGLRTTVTTPDTAEVYALLALFAELGANSVVMEVSSHALALGRVAGLTFDVAAFTNFGRDHLDFHRDLDSYFAAKAKLFTAGRARAAVINIEDPRGPELVRQAVAAGLAPVRTIGLDATADISATELSAAGAVRTLVRTLSPSGPATIDLGLPGEFNVRNALTALAMAELAGVELKTAAAGLADAVVPGRMQRVALPAGAPTVFVDFAHTPQAVAAVLESLQQTHARDHRVIVVLGCGGDRDPEKRAPMGAAAATAADLVVVTDDNPRSEDPAQIRAQVLAGARHRAMTSAGRPVAVVDGGQRLAAIRVALSAAGPEDVVAILGKGHERGQEVAGQVLPFFDVDAVQELAAELFPTGADAPVADATAEGEPT